MMPLLHRPVGRVVLTVVLLLATQLAFAGQLCRAVMMGSVADACPAHALGQAGDLTLAVDLQLCCDCVVIPASTCVTALGDVSLVALASGGAPLADLAPPFRDRSTVAIIGAASGPVLVPTTSVGPPLPSYIIFHRFLS